MISLVNVLEYSGASVPLLYKLLLERPNEANISHRSMPTMENHKDHVMHHPHVVWYMILAGTALYSAAEESFTNMVGAIYLSQQSEIGIGILKEFQHKGYAKQAIEALMAKHPRPHYLANVAPANQPSHELFQGMGFEMIQMTYKFSRL